MDTNKPKFNLQQEAFEIVGCAMEVLNTLGHGLLEKPYENALVIEFKIKGIPYKQLEHFDLIYKKVKVGEYIPNLIAYEQMVIDTKVIEQITNHDRGQIINYLRITNLRVGLILNFKKAKLEWERLIR